MTDDQLEEFRELPLRDTSYALHSGCTDYRCDCHDAVPVLLAEIDRLKKLLRQYEAD